MKIDKETILLSQLGKALGSLMYISENLCVRDIAFIKESTKKRVEEINKELEKIGF